MVERMMGTTRFFENRFGRAAMILLWGVLETVVLSIAAYQSSLATFPPNTFVDPSYRYTQAVASTAMWLMIGLAVLLGYLVADVGRGVIAYVASELIAFPLTSLVLLLLPVRSPMDTLELVGSIAVFAPSILTRTPRGPVYVIGFGILVTLVGVVGAIIGTFLRERRDPEGTSSSNWLFMVVALLLDSIAVFLPISVPQFNPFFFPLNFGVWALPVMAGLISAGLVFAIVGLRWRPTGSDVDMGLLTIVST